MTPLSNRFASALLALLVLALVPVAIHSYGDFRSDDCADPAALADLGRMSQVVEVRENEKRQTASRIQWTDGVFAPVPPGLPRMRFRVVRSLEPSDFYMRPVRFLESMPFPPEPRIRWIDAGSQKLPVQFVYRYAPGASRVAAYMFAYDSRPVVHPFPVSLANAIPDLVSGTRPVTFFLIYGDAPDRRLPELEEKALEWMTAAWSYYDRVCSP